MAKKRPEADIKMKKKKKSVSIIVIEMIFEDFKKYFNI